MIGTAKSDGGNSSPPLLRVLILEDNPADAKLTASVLEAGGYAVQPEVTDSREVFRERLEKAEYDVILADYNLRNWTAIDALETLKRMGKDIPLIVVTGSLGDEAAVECIKQGAADFVLKDRPARLPAAVRRALEERGLRAEKKRAEEALQNEQAFTQSIIDGLPDGFYVIDSDGRFVRWNTSAGSALGYSSKEFAAMDPFATVAEEDRPLAARKLQEALAKGSATAEVNLLAKSGRKIPYFLTATRSVIGDQTYLVGMAVDISERRRAEEALKESERKYRQLHESMMDGFVRLNLDGKIMEVNDAFCHMLGYTAEELLQSTHNDVTPEKWYDFEGNIITKEVLTRGYSDVYAKELRHKDGHNIPVEVRAYRMLDESGNPIGLWAIVRNITERKRAEEALQDSERKYRQLHESMRDGFVRLDLDGRITETNDAFCKILGCGAEDLLNLPYNSLIPEKWAIVEKCVNEEKVLTRGYSNIYFKEYQRKDGAIIPVEVRKHLILDEAGSPCGMWAIVRDITERKWAEEMLREYEKVVEGSDAMIAVIDREYCYLLANHAYLEQRGLEREDLLGSSVEEVVGEKAFKSVIKEKLDECFQGNTVRYELREQYPKLGERDILVSYFPIEGPHGVDRAAVILQDITDRKRAEKAILESGERYRTLFENAPVGIYRTTPDGRVLAGNPALVRMFGYSSFEELARRNLNTRGSGPEYPRSQFVELMEEKGEVTGLESTWHKEDGGIVHIRENARAIRDDAGEILYYEGTVEDITENKRAEEAIKESEVRYRTLFENAPVGIYRTTPEGRIVAVNPALAKMLGYSSVTKLIGRDLNAGDFEPQYPRTHFMALMEERGEVTGLESTWRKEDGGTVYVRENARAIRDDFGKILYYEGTVEDITENKRAEAEHVRLVTAIEQSAEAVVITDITGSIEYVNPAFTRITGYSREEALGENPRILKSGKQDPAFHEQLWATILRGEIWHGEVINRRKDGSLYTEHMNIAPIRSERGDITHFIATKEDVTVRKQLEQQLIQAQKMEAVGRLAGGVAHDFNNLLTIINGYSQLLTEQISTEDPRRDQLNEILKAGERAASLTRQLLAFSRRQVLEPKILDLNSVLADLQKMLRRLIGEDIELVTTLKPKLGRVKVDPGQIEQVIMNLAVNARDAMPEGGKLYIETNDVEVDEDYAQSHSNMMPGKYVMLAVTDTGIGMDADTQARIFEPFFTTKGKGQGTGLGLAMVYGIVKQSGGFIWVYSESGQGATFKIYFPVVGEDALAAEPARASAKPANGSETILVVEDEDGVRGLVCHTLKTRGYHVLEAQGAEQALKLSEQHGKPIHLLLTDVVMPHTGGKELAKFLSALHPETKVLYMSGYTDDAIVRRGILEEGTAFLQKPFAPDALVRKVREVLRGKPGTQF
jgi:PAS domain S-box-containing protein